MFYISPNIEANLPSLFTFITSFGVNTFPFMHMCIPGSESCVFAIAYPIQNGPSEGEKPASGIMDPVIIMT